MITPVVVEEEPALSEAESRQIIGSLVSYNDVQAGLQNQQALNMIARQEGQIVAGLLGYTNWGWLFVRILWVAPELRGSGLGRRLVFAAEAQAQTRGCRHAHLDTFSFQALGFYERLGYHVFGRLEDYPVGHTRYFLEKRDLCPYGDALSSTHEVRG